VATEYKPKIGQAGRDVVWVPTPRVLVHRLLDMAGARRGDFLVDIGSGDGRTVIAAAKRGIRAHGIEYNADLISLARAAARADGLCAIATFERADIFQATIPDASVVTLFLLPALNLKLRPILLDMKPGTRIVSNMFGMGDWQADDEITAEGDCTSWSSAYKWVVPAKVSGAWMLRDWKLELTQSFQMLSGEFEHGGSSWPISEGKVEGNRIRFVAGKRSYIGEAGGGSILLQMAGGESRRLLHLGDPQTAR
jgi:SAM-dependent methyltransferase